MGRTAALLLLWVGCNLISSDLTKVTVQLPIETYTVDTSDNTNVKLPEMLPDLRCHSNTECCPFGCSFDGYTIACADVGGTASCQATAKVSLVTKIDLSADPNLAKA